MTLSQMTDRVMDRLRRTRRSRGPYRNVIPGPDVIEDVEIWRRVSAFTLTGPERVQAMVDAIRYLDRHSIPGSIVECGVWRGGSMMAAALALLESGSDRDLFLFDTYDGMSEPSGVDIDHRGRSAAMLLAGDPTRSALISAVVGLDEVRSNLESTGYPANRMHFVEGRVEDTIPDAAPLQIAFLRLDTDWYESTRHELEHLLPRVVSGGVLIIDDYGHWDGARKAVDEHLESTGTRMLLHRIDYTARMAIIQ